MPFVHPHLALMPDAHLGKGATVGSVIPTLGAIIPAAVGVDIGCGMMAVQTQFTRDQLPGDRRALHACDLCRDPAVRRQVQRVGTSSRPLLADRGARGDGRVEQADEIAPNWRCSSARSAPATTSSRSRSTRTTACGCSCTPGSRGVGNQLAQKWIKIAQHSASSAGSCCPTPISRTWSRASRSSAATWRRCAGLSASRSSTARR